MIDARIDAAKEHYGAAPELTPVAVTRWTARLVDPRVEQDYLLYRFADDRRRVLFLTGLVAIASTLNFLVSYATNAPSFAATLIPAIAGIVLPIIGFGIALRLRSPHLLQTVMVIAVLVGTLTRLSMLTLRPDTADMWMTLMVGIVFVIYLYLPIRLAGSVAVAALFSCVAPYWWLQVLGDVLTPDVFYRGLVWLFLANALGFTAANSLQRSQRMQYAQGLVMRHLLSTDAMTGIANRRRFDAALEREWRRCRRAGAPLSLLMIDVDHFKAYNDYCGHPQGDACLRQLAQVLVDTIKRPGDVVARYGGEEFVVLMPEIGAAGALAVANKLAAALRQADISHPRSPAGPRMTISIGAATAKKLTGEPASLVEFADKLLYAAKAAGRNQVAVGQLTPADPTARAA
ncbi:MAG: GGDEF domain-containing protein [Pseudolabrys sp.]|nr:GGDEF domain-containing protein [Pseudolabrys sp.]MDP2299070.1 GGDEF domain-containing protein [Pseudolabrys sp.]